MKFSALVLSLTVLAAGAAFAVDNPEDYYKEGHRKFFESNFRAAAVEFAKAIALNPNVPKYHFFLGRTFERLRAEPKAIESYRTCIKLEPKHIQAMSRLGNIFLEQGAFRKAIQEFEPILRVRDSDFEAYHRIGQCYFNLSDYPAAVRNLQKAIEVDPKNPYPMFFLGRTYLEMGEWAKAVDMLSKSVELDASNAEFFFWLGSAYYATGDFRNDKEEFWHSGQNFRRAIEMGYSNPTSLFMLGNSLLHRGIFLITNNREQEATEHLKAAVTQYQQVIKAQPDASNAFLNLGLGYYALKKFDDALTAIRKAIELEPTVDFFHDFLGNTLYVLGRFDDAVEQWTLVKELNDKYEPQTSSIFGIEGKPIKDKVLSARRKR
ncbi:MAG: hypothetical protein A3G34_04300 [Candidatus Lindowbacteria bacterium RIFCSPLOWO2_12_FULL_62_27]|nr:MAG: hypothetical protein A3G34_04300 [Candidatus Lindowbacteria bacterium RIFCSPLOWO2_12_FULL_62_27]OGH63776.1 MAG: hypothetical protein A3I06_12695 [Candidatus Lindowbacteria bacterium RIFCSPLOWO2_02_FULL_62_12]